MADEDDIITSVTGAEREPSINPLEAMLRRIVSEGRDEQRGQLEDIRHGVHSLDVQTATVATKVGALSERVAGIESRVKTIEGSMGTIVSHYHETSEIVAALDGRTQTISKRLSEEHKSLAEVAKEQRSMRINCVTHNGNMKSLSDETKSAKCALDHHAVEMKALAKQLEALTNSTGRFQVRMATTWRTLALAGGTFVTVVTLTLGLLKAFGLI